MGRDEVVDIARQMHICNAIQWMSDGTIAALALECATDLVDHSFADKSDIAVLHSALMTIAEERGWPDGWWEDPSVVPSLAKLCQS
jgi:hypothetical protein